jgi:hypothetical protein
MDKRRVRQDRSANEAHLPKRAPHEEWLIDEANRGSFPASDPASTSQPGSLASERYANPSA